MKFLRMLCFGFFLTVAMNAVYALSPKIASYSDLGWYLDEGDDVAAILYLDRCTMANGQPGPSASTRVNFNIFSHYKIYRNGEEKYTIATSNTILTEHNVLGVVLAYGRLRVFEDNTAEFHVTYLDPKTYVKKAGVDYYCKLGTDKNKSSMVLLNKSRNY